jgi:hypothetical protein
MIIPVVIGATGIVTKGLRKNLEAIPGKHSIDSLQKTAILGTLHINTESMAVWNFIPEWWGSPLVQEKYQGEMACNKRQQQQQQNNNNNNNSESSAAIISL